MRFQTDIAVLPRHDPDKRHMVEAYIPDASTRHGSVDGLRTAGANSKVRLYKAIPDGNGEYLTDKAGHTILGEFIEELD